jgi:hypothetical protein
VSDTQRIENVPISGSQADGSLGPAQRRRIGVLAGVEEVVDGELGAPEARPAPVQETTR